MMTQKEKIGFYSIGVNVLLVALKGGLCSRRPMKPILLPVRRREKRIKVSEWLLAKGIDTVYTPKGFEGKGPGYVFSDAGVDVMLTGG